MFTRRQFLKMLTFTTLGMAMPWRWSPRRALAETRHRPGVEAYRLRANRLDPTLIPKYQTRLVIPPVMPRSGELVDNHGADVDYYEIALRQFQQQILPPGLPATTVWSYGAVLAPGTARDGGSFHYPAFTIEAAWDKPVRIKWLNELVDDQGRFLPHLLSVDQTLHWANPGGHSPDSHGHDPTPYRGPVPMVTHVHGAHVHEESDGYAEAWFLPATEHLASGVATHGSRYEQFRATFAARYGEPPWEPGSAVFQYPNDQRATTLWYHDHTLGMTRLNVYAGPAGFYLIRGGPDDDVRDKTGAPVVLPGPAPAPGDAPGTRYYEIPIAVQDRSFNDDGSLFYPDSRAYFEGRDPEQLDIPFIPDTACNGEPSDVSPIWVPEFFGEVMVTNGVAWPFMEVEQRRYRFRLLNGSNSRFLILKFDYPEADVWQIGAEGGFLAEPVHLKVLNDGEILLAPAERADVIVDFSNIRVGGRFKLINLAPDEPFGGGERGVDYAPSDANTTGQVLEFRVIRAVGPDTSTPPGQLVLPAVTPLEPTVTRRVSLNEMMSMSVFVTEDAQHHIVQDCASGVPFGPTGALLGPMAEDNTAAPQMWSAPITEKPRLGATEMWEIYNFTVDAHPIHIHLVEFQVVNRQGLVTDHEGMAVQPVQLVPDTIRAPEPWESGFKDTVIAYPGQVTRIRARFDLAGLYAWHCHIVEHEDNEMMRPYRVEGYTDYIPNVTNA